MEKRENHDISWVERPNIVKIHYRFNIIPIKIAARHFVDRGKVILKFAWKGKGIRIIETLLKKKNQFKRITPLDLTFTTKLE